MIDGQGREVGSWAAYNNVDSHATLRHLQNGSYTVQDQTVPHSHPADPNGPFGSYGIIRFNVPGHVGIGVHSGEAQAAHRPGPPHWTMGCIRTSDDGMHAISNAMKVDALTVVEVAHNEESSARSATLRNRGRVLNGRAHG